MANLLIVDDDRVMSEYLAAVLRRAGHAVRTAMDGVEGLEQVQITPHPDLVIADILMPTMDGFEFVRRLRELAAFAHTPVVFHTVQHLEAEARALARESGVEHILTKPTPPQEIVRLVQEVLGSAWAVAESSPAAEASDDLRAVPMPATSGIAADQPRFDAMMELSLRLAGEREPSRILDYFCASARKVIGAKYAVVGVLEAGQRRVRYECGSGMSREIMERLPNPPLPVRENILFEQRPSRLRALPGSPEAVGLPAIHPPVHSFLCAPIASPDRAYGWLCLADKVGVTDFSAEDENIAQILSAQAGRIYENSSLLSEVRHSVVQLEAEIAERQRAQDEFRRLHQTLEHRMSTCSAEVAALNEELQSLSFSVSHDLRSPLTTIKGFADLLLNFHPTRLDPVVRDGVENIRDAATRMNKLIEELVSLARISQREVIFAPVDLSALARQIIADLRRVEPQRVVDAEIDAGIVAQGDVGLVRIVFENLLRNAWKFTSRCARAVITVGSEWRRGRQVFFVRDNGVGFDGSRAGRLFGPFQRLHHRSDFPGAGMGLALARRIIHRHGGEIWAESTVDRGATFYFTLGARSPGETKERA